MAMVTYGTVLEYATNTLTLSLYGDNNEPIDFASDTSFSIRRVDDDTITYSVGGTGSGNTITFVVTPPSYLKKAGDSLFSTDDGITHHIYSVKSSSNVYMQGKLKLIEVA